MDKLKYCDFSIICRICLTKGGITFTTDAVTSSVFHKLTDLDFQTDDLPQQICLNCFEKINEIQRFYFQCKRSHSLLTECLNQQRILEPKREIVDVPCNDISDEIENHTSENEIKEETTTNSEIFKSLEKLKTEELKVNILIVEPDVLEVTTNNKIIEPENKRSVNNDECSYKCGKCIKTFIRKSHLIQHERIHKNKRSYKCTQCSKVFKSPSHLVNHKRLHSGERPYKCGQCSKTFSKSQPLILHERYTHSAERLFKCDQCPRTFKRPNCRRKHELQHSDRRPYQCDQCLEIFSYKYILNEHVKTHKKITSIK